MPADVLGPSPMHDDTHVGLGPTSLDVYAYQDVGPNVCKYVRNNRRLQHAYKTKAIGPYVW